MRALLILLRQTVLHIFDDHLQYVVSRLPGLQRLYIHLQTPSQDGVREPNLSLIKLLPRLYERALKLRPTLDVRLVLSFDRAESLLAGGRGKEEQAVLFKEGPDSKLSEIEAQNANLYEEQDGIDSRK